MTGATPEIGSPELAAATLACLPDMPVTRDIADVDAFFAPAEAPMGTEVVNFA